jgi:DNA-binding response OmpR family regulator
VADTERRGSPSLHVLIVEDEADIARTWVWLLSSMGHRAEVAPDGPAALRAAEAEPPDAVLLDLGLPGMSGYDVARQLRQRSGGSARPLIIAVTGFGQDEDRLRSYEVGIDLHLVKPVQPEELKGFLDRFQRVTR